MRKTTVICVRGRDRAELLADPDFVYVGRPCRGWKGSIFGNPYGPFHPATGERPPGRMAEMFAEWLATGEPQEAANPKAQARRHAAIMAALPSLRGKVLGCWCVDWDGTGEPARPCHAVILARLADAIPTEAAPDA